MSEDKGPADGGAFLRLGVVMIGNQTNFQQIISFTVNKKIILIVITFTLLIFLTMGLFSFFKKPVAKTQKVTTTQTPANPYADSSANFMYHALFCDDINLYKLHQQQPYQYPFDVLYDEAVSTAALQKIIDDSTTEPRVKILAYNKQMANGHIPQKQLLAVIVEVGLDKGLDVLASFYDGTACYINHTEKMLIWENTTDKKANTITDALFLSSEDIVKQIGPWSKPRKPFPTKGNARISFLVSDGLYFGEGPIDVLFNDPKGSTAMACATSLMQYITEYDLNARKSKQ